MSRRYLERCRGCGERRLLYPAGAIRACIDCRVRRLRLFGGAS